MHLVVTSQVVCRRDHKRSIDGVWVRVGHGQSPSWGQAGQSAADLVLGRNRIERDHVQVVRIHCMKLERIGEANHQHLGGCSVVGWVGVVVHGVRDRRDRVRHDVYCNA
eukprot:760748-Hanusia_phi.AAC.2